MKKFTTTMLHSLLIGILFGYTLVTTISHSEQIQTMQAQLANYRHIFRDIAQEEVHVATYMPYKDLQWRIEELEEIPDWSWYIGRHAQRLQSLEYDVLQLNRQVFFPYVSQVGVDAPYVDDCGSASILMVAKFYGMDTGETVLEIHDQMIGSDLPANYIQMTDFIEEKYTLNTKVIATHPAIKEDLIEGGYTDGEDIEVIDPSEFPNDEIVIWIYSRVPHWIVRYKGWAYDPLLGIRRFEATEDIYRPDYGLGIIVWP